MMSIESEQQNTRRRRKTKEEPHGHTLDADRNLDNRLVNQGTSARHRANVAATE